MIVLVVSSDVHHLGAGIGLLMLGRQRYGVELDRTIALQDHAQYFHVMDDPAST